MKRIIVLAFALVSVSAVAEIKLPSVISDNMVIQRNTDAALWGWADPGKKVTVTPSWSKKKVTVTADALNLAPKSTRLMGFELAGADRVFHPAIGAIGLKSYSAKQIVVTSTDVPEPVAVRYCFRNWSAGSVYNAFYVPLAPFRSDDWDDVRK